ncbi:MAG: DUF427 domain-containing protein [Betaproteobacteria bacterium]|jgi:uncharacterized protein (DUF427 family)
MSALWRYSGHDRPGFAETPGPGQESVWDYPRPPHLVPDTREIVVRVGDIELARTRRALRLLETASPPTFYLPFADARPALLVEAHGMASHCEWKGSARYWSIFSGDVRLAGVAWSYPSPKPPYEKIATRFSVYPARVACFVDGEGVKPQEGGFYGGWVTGEIVGPWKGGVGSSGW